MHGCNSPTNYTESQSPLHQLLLNLFSFFMSPRSLSHPISIPLAAYPLTRVVAHLDWTLILQTLITGFPSLSHKHDKVNKTSFFFFVYIFITMSCTCNACDSNAEMEGSVDETLASAETVSKK